MIERLMTNSRNTEVDGTTTRITGAYQNTTLNSDPNLPKIFSLLKIQLALLSAAINRIKTESEQQGKDDVRDNRARALYFLLMSFSHHPNAAVKNAAIELLEVFENYGLAMLDESYATETSLMNSLLGDYAKPKYQASIALVPQSAEYITSLTAAQTDFENTRIAFEEARAQEGTQENATAIKKEVLRIINNLLVPYLNVMEQLNEPVYGAFARTVAEIISENNEMVKKRRRKPGEGE